LPSSQSKFAPAFFPITTKSLSFDEIRNILVSEKFLPNPQLLINSFEEIFCSANEGRAAAQSNRFVIEIGLPSFARILRSAMAHIDFVGGGRGTNKLYTRGD